MTDQPQPQPEPNATPPEAEADKAVYRDVTALVATVDQLSAEADAMQAQLLVSIFAIGALAGLMFVMHRQIRELAGAVA